MKDKRIWPFKRRAEEDNLITAGACRLILRIASWRYCTKHHPADAEFSLSWRHMAAWYDNDGPETIRNQKTIYDWVRELVQNRYLHYNGRKGCPAQSCYRLDLDYKPETLSLFNWAAEKAAEIVTQLTGKPDNWLTGKPDNQIARKPANKLTGKTVPPNIGIPFGKKCSTKGKKLSGAKRRQARFARDNEGKELARSARNESPPLSLCDGQDASAVPTSSDTPAKTIPPGGRATSPPDDLSTGAGTGGTIPPAGTRKGARTLSTTIQSQMDLHKARYLVQARAWSHVHPKHVVALLEAGDKIPDDLVQRFPALCEKFNPIPG